MKLYKVTLHSSIDTEFAVIAQSESDAIDILRKTGYEIC